MPRSKSMRLDSMTHGDPAPSRTLKLTIAYDGSAYAGWQFQVDRPTVQTALEAAIVKVTGQTVRVLASGRTDAGVHALGQVVGVRTDSTLPPEVLLRALNANLPRDIAVLDVAEAPEGFHPIGSVVRKRYRYVIHDGPVRDVFQRHYTWHYNYGRLDADAMQPRRRTAAGQARLQQLREQRRRAEKQRPHGLRADRRAGQGSQSPLSLWERGRG